MLLNLAAGAYADSAYECVNRTFHPNEGRELLENVGEECDIISTLCSGYVVKSDRMQHLILVFRGTKTKVQLLLEGWMSQTDGADFFQMGNVNKYFLNAHNVLWAPMERVLTHPLYQNYAVTITGHSLGGALAALAAARTVKQGIRQSGQVRLVTFGEPRVGSAKFAKNFDQLVPNSYRVVFRADIVPHLPACHKDLSDTSLRESDAHPCDDYEGTAAYHHGTEIWYPDCMAPGCTYMECTGLPKNEDMQCSDRLKFKPFPDISDYISDHRHYFDVKVTEFGKTGCDGVFNATDIKESTIHKIVSSVSMFLSSLG
ncbi:unnamed protein product, partial [Mesorhabditis belari]|uniref:Fungal lipase-type domain-containing protein n=1 Tax=Mesorhabditis belari TaxID=2138241 RepID=A0AAF3FQM2_9BILA